MLILEIQILIETVLSVLLLIGIALALYAFINLHRIKKAQEKLSSIKKELKTILYDAENDLTKLKIKSDILKSSIQKTIDKYEKD